MKRLAVLLLVILIPLSAAAEAYSFSVSFSTDEALFPIYLQEAMLMAPETVGKEESQLAIRLIQYLLNGLSFDVHLQDDMLAVACSVSGKPLFDVNLINKDETSYIVSSLLQGCALISDRISKTDTASLNDELARMGWSDVVSTAAQVFSSWQAGLEQTVAAGEFSGDAYDGGSVCRTWVLSDRDIANLIDMLLTQDLRAVLNEVLNASGQEGLLRQFDALNADVAEADAYLYLLRVVENEQNELCGVSLTVLRDMQQIATASLGVKEKGMTLVVGLGVAEGNYWWELTANRRERNGMTAFSGASREWLADKEMDFSFVSAKAAPVSEFDWHCYITKSGRRYLWDASIYEDMDQAGYRYLVSSDGKVNANTNELDFTLSLGDAPYVPASVKVKLAPTATQTMSLDDLIHVSLDEPFDLQMNEELLEKASAVLAARLLKILPADLFLQMLDMNTGE